MADFLYKGVVDWFLGQMSQGELSPGEKMPSLRKLSKQLELSLNTVIHGYEILMEEGWIESRPKSGYFVCHKTQSRTAHVLAGDKVARFAESEQKMAWSALSHRAALVDQSDAFLNPSPRAGEPDLPVLGKGHLAVREAVAEHLRKVAITVHPANIWLSRSPLGIYTQAIQTLTQVNDTVLVVTPCDPRLTSTLMSLGRQVLTLASGERGVDLDEVVRCLRDDNVKLVVFPSQFAFPAGSEISNLSLRRWMAILQQVDVPAIEWDMTSHLGYKVSTLMTYKSLDERNQVVYIGGIESKGVDRNAAWCVVGQHKSLEGALLSADLALSDPQQQALLDALQPTQAHSLAKRARQIWSIAEKAKSTLESALGESVQFASSKGGLALWLQMESPLTESQMTQLLAKHRHGMIAGSLLSAQPEASEWLAVNVTYEDLAGLAKQLSQFLKVDSAQSEIQEREETAPLMVEELEDVAPAPDASSEALSDTRTSEAHDSEAHDSEAHDSEAHDSEAHGSETHASKNGPTTKETVYNPMLDLINHDFG